jgi:hypothetical protein
MRTTGRTTLGGLPLTSSSTSVVAAAGPAGSTPRGAAIDVILSFGGGHCRTRRQHPQGGPLSMSSSTSVVATAERADNKPKGARH